MILNKKVFSLAQHAILQHQLLPLHSLTMKTSTLSAITLPLLVLAACTSTSTPVVTDTSSIPSVSSVAMQETKNVTYQGILQPAGSSIFMEGTHKLQLEDGRFIMLEGTGVDINAYIGKKVELLGAVRPTVEAGGMIMRVEKITSLEASSSSSASGALMMSSSESSSAVSATMTYVGVVQISPSGTCEIHVRGKNSIITLLNFTECKKNDGKTMEISGTIDTTVSSHSNDDVHLTVTNFHEILTASSVAMVSSSSASAKPVASSSVTPVSSSPISVASSVAAVASSAAYEASTELTDKAAIMAKDNLAANLWTQQYCSKTAGYCLSVHKNWYFKSFGATSTTLWHVEVGSQEINNIGEGPVSVNLVSGTVESAGGTDGQVTSKNGGVVGYKSWTDNRHFEILGPSNLQAAISFMLGSLKAN